jgi:hypothetical protein
MHLGRFAASQQQLNDAFDSAQQQYGGEDGLDQDDVTIISTADLNHKLKLLEF